MTQLPRLSIIALGFLVSFLFSFGLYAQVSFDRSTIDGNFQGYFVKAFDLDRDGNLDILAGHTQLAWWRNDGQGNFSKNHISNDVSALWGICPFDLDRDGDIDLLIADSGNNDIVWYRNNGGSFQRIVIESNFINSESVTAGDFDGDGDMDIAGLTVGTSTESGMVVWWENNGGNSFSRRDLDLGFERGHKIAAEDIDHDGRTDIVAIGAWNNGLAWWENNGGGSFSKHIISSGGGLGMTIADMDGDGSLDVVKCDHGSGRVSLFYNNGSGNFSGGDIASGLSWPSFPAVGDINQDGRKDVVVFNRDSNDLVWLENQGGSFSVRFIDDGLIAPFVGDVGDFDGDGVPDITSGSKDNYKVYWWRTGGATAPKSITVQYPNGGETFTGNSNLQISWTSSGNVGSVDIQFSSNQGHSWQQIASSTSNDGQYDWQLPPLDSGECLIRILEAGSGSPSDASDNTFTLESPTLSLSGNIYYAEGSTPVPGVDVQFSGDVSRSETTNAAGFYEVNEIPAGSDLNIDPQKSSGSSQNAATITSFDAALAARYALDLVSLDPIQAVAADVDRSGQVLLYDAAIIARSAVGLPELPETYVKDWYFDPEGTSVNNIDEDLTGFDFKGVVLGDVSLSWNGVSKASGYSNSRFASINSSIVNGDVAEFTFLLPAHLEILSFDLTINFDESHYDYINTKIQPPGSGMNVLVNLTNNQLRIGGYAVSHLTEDFELVVSYEILSGPGPGIVVDQFIINDGIIVTSAVVELNDGVASGSTPTSFRLRQNYPNPFNGETIISYDTPETGEAYVVIYDIRGRIVFSERRFHNRPGSYAMTWPGLDSKGNRVPGGIYLLRFFMNKKAQDSMKITYIP